VSKREEIIKIANQRGEGAHLLDALWLCALGDFTNLRRLRLQCRNSGQKIAEHEISEMIEYLEASETERKNDGGWGSCSGDKPDRARGRYPRIPLDGPELSKIN
jgi:hypothetical protein